MSFADLLRFYINPQKFFIKDCLGIHLDSGEELPDDREIFEVSGLNKYHVEEEMVRSELSGEPISLSNIRNKIQTEGRWPLGTSGQLAFEQTQAGIESFTEKIHEQQMGVRLTDLPIDLSTGNHRLVGALSNLYENGVMLVRYGKLRGRDLLSGWIHHIVLSRLIPSPETRIVAMDRVVSFSKLAEGPDLGTLLNHFIEGGRAPSLFFIEPAFVYASQLANKRSRTSPIEKALQILNTRLQKGYEPEWELLLSGSGEELVFGEDFERFCHEIMCPVWSAADE